MYVKGANTLAIPTIVNFLIIFPFVMAIIIGLLREATPLRSAVIILGGFTIMVSAIYVAVNVLMSGDTSQFMYLQETHIPDTLVICGEIFLMGLVCFLSIKYKKYYAILFFTHRYNSRTLDGSFRKCG